MDRTGRLGRLASGRQALRVEVVTLGVDELRDLIREEVTAALGGGGPRGGGLRDRRLTCDEVAEMAGVAPGTVYRWSRERVWGFPDAADKRNAHGYRWSEREVREWLEGGRGK